MAKSKIEELTNSLKYYKEKYEEAVRMNRFGSKQIWLKKISDTENSIKDELNKNNTDLSSIESITTQEIQLEIVQPKTISAEDANKLGAWREEYDAKDPAGSLRKIYDKVIAQNPINQPQEYGFGPLNKEFHTKVFEAIFPFIIEDMVNKKIDGYIPKLKYQTEEVNGISKATLIIGDIENVSIEEWDGSFVTVQDEETGKTYPSPSIREVNLSGMKFNLQEFITKVNFLQLDINETIKQQYSTAIKQTVGYHADNPENITKTIATNDPEDNHFLNKFLSDSGKVALNLYTGDFFAKVNWVMHRCNMLDNESLEDLVNPALSTVAIGSEAIDKFPLDNNVSSIVVRGEDSHSRFSGSRFDELVNNVQNGIITKNTSLLSTSIQENGKPYGNIKLLIKDAHGIYVGPMSDYGDGEKELLLPASQQIAFDAYAKTLDNYHIFVGQAVNMVSVADYTSSITNVVSDNDSDWLSTLGTNYFDDIITNQ